MCAGRITHHDEVSRLKKVYELVKEARQQVEGKLHSWLMSPNCTGLLLGSTRMLAVPRANKAFGVRTPSCATLSGRL